MKPLPFNPENWGYEFEYWVPRLGGVPTHLFASHDRSKYYEMDRAHVFKIRPGRYALVREIGCSCYLPKDADIFIYGDERSVMADYMKWLEDGYPFKALGVKAK